MIDEGRMTLFWAMWLMALAGNVGCLFLNRVTIQDAEIHSTCKTIFVLLAACGLVGYIAQKALT